MLQVRILVKFEVENPFHRDHAIYFIENNKWRLDAPRFFLEDGYTTVPGLIKDKLCLFYAGLDSQLKQIRSYEK